MSRISARLIGQQIGRTAHEVNLMLEQIGFIKKSNLITLKGSQTWDITDLGRLHGGASRNPYSSGYIWDKEVVDILISVFHL